MEYVLSFALFVLNLIDYERDLGTAVFTILSVILFSLLFFFVYRKSKNFLATCLIMMCHTWQISWINIFGEPTSELQVPWFYLLGALIVGYAIFNIGKCLKRSYNVYVLVIFVFFLIFFNYPLAISQSVKEGLKEYIMIGFYMVVLLAAYLFKDEIPKRCYDQFKSAFIWACVTSSILLIFQYFMYTEFGMKFFKIKVVRYLTHFSISCQLLMEDNSCSTIMLGAGVFYIAERITKKKWFVYVPTLVMVFVAMALTSRRTSTFTLVGVLMVYVLTHYKGLGKKVLFTSIFVLATFAMAYYLLSVRPVDSLSQALSDNGRYVNYKSAYDVMNSHPLGVGYDNDYLVSLMADGVVPHNTLLRWICMGSFIFPIPLIGVIGYVIMTAYKKRMTCEYWAVIYSVIASNFIPDILNARFFVIPCAAVFLFRMAEGTAADPPTSRPEIKEAHIS